VLQIVLTVLATVAWLALVVDCLRARRLAPSLGRPWVTKVFWLLCFCFLDPLILAAYVVLGRLVQPPPAWRRAYSAAIVIGTLAVLTFSPLSYVLERQRPLVLERNPSGTLVESGGSGLPLPSLGLSADFCAQESGSSSSRGGSRPNRVVCRDVLVLARSSHPVVHEAALAIQRKLSRVEFIRRVRCFPAGSYGEKGEIAPDWVIAVVSRESGKGRAGAYELHYQKAGIGGVAEGYTDPSGRWTAWQGIGRSGCSTGVRVTEAEPGRFKAHIETRPLGTQE